MKTQQKAEIKVPLKGKNLKSIGGVDPIYTYDLNGNRILMYDPASNATWAYAYDVMNRVTEITNPDNGITVFTYDANGRRTSMTYPNGVVTSYVYDAAGRLTNLTTQDSQLTILNSYMYTHDGVGNRLSMTDNDGTHTYTYDDQYRLTSATHPQAYNPDEFFTYDPVGNRLSSHLSSSYVYNPYDKQLNRLSEDDTYNYSYDDNGNLTSKTDKVSLATTSYTYDTENRLIQVITSTDVSSYQYDGFGRRIVKTVNGVVTKYVYDRLNVLFELDGNDQIKTRYTYNLGIDEPISVDKDTDGNSTLDITYYYHRDGLGSVTAMTDSSGNVVQTYVYDSFGNIVDQTGSVENSYTYTSREWDAEAGLYYYRARYYDAIVGRFIQEDPSHSLRPEGDNIPYLLPTLLKTPQALHKYVYVQNNPINRTDPLGLDVPGPIKKWACSYTPKLCCYLDKLKCLNKLNLKTCPPEDIKKCEKKFLRCIANAGK